MINFNLKTNFFIIFKSLKDKETDGLHQYIYTYRYKLFY